MSAERSIIALTVVVVALFVGARVYTSLRASSLDTEAYAIARDAGPGMAVLTRLRGDLLRMEQAADETIERAAGGEAAGSSTRFDDAVRVARSDLDTWKTLPQPPAARTLEANLERAIAATESAWRDALSRAAAGDLVGARELRDRTALPTSDVTDGIIGAIIDAKARYARTLADEIARHRRETTLEGGLLDALASLLAVLFAVIAVRIARQRSRLLEERSQLERTRAEELEMFAARVAHDVRNPISTALLSLETVRWSAEGGRSPPLAPLDRGIGALHRAARILDDLFSFAQAGGRARPGARAVVQPVVEAVIDEERPGAEQAGIELVVEGRSARAVTTGEGLLTVVLSNLVRNAIKYLGDSPEKRVVVRVVDADAAVRIEVEDTGPGIPEGAGETIFEPFVRGAAALARPGLGLGLATVRRAVDASGGRVGVRRGTVGGACFWFELPALP